MLNITSKTPIVFALMVATFYAGQITKVEREPCIRNLHSMTYPWFGRVNQEALENTTPYSKDSIIYKDGYETPRDFIKAVLESSTEEKRTEIFVNQRNGEEFIVPALCYVGEVDGLGDPVLYWKN